MNEELNKTWTSKLGKAADIFIDPIQQRMSNPIVGSFALTWCTLNWQPIVFFIFSKQSIECKFGYISSNFYKGDWYIFHQNWWMYLIIPFLISSFYVIFSQRIENFVDWLNSKPLIRKQNHNHSGIIEHLTKQAAIATKEAEVLEARTQYKTLEQKDLLIQEIQKDNQNFKEQELELNEQITELRGELNGFKIDNLELKKELSSVNTSNDNTYFEISNIFDKLFKTIPLERMDESISYIKNQIVSDPTIKKIIDSGISEAKNKLEKENEYYDLIVEGYFENEHFIDQVVTAVNNLFYSLTFPKILSNKLVFEIRFDDKIYNLDERISIMKNLKDVSKVIIEKRIRLNT